jgi:crossover junction endonuclease EME1
MSTHEVIDLCLSTDEEPTPKPRIIATETTKTAINTTFHSDDLDFAFSPEISRASKRRRLSPTDGSLDKTSHDAIASTQDGAASHTVTSTKPAKPSKLMIESDPILFTSSPSFHPGAASGTTALADRALPIRMSSPFRELSDEESPAEVRDNVSVASDEFDLGSLARITKDSVDKVPSTYTHIAGLPDSPKKKPPPKKHTPTTSSTVADKERLKAERAAARLATAEAKAVAKIEAAARKKAEKEEKAREKKHAADLAEANKARYDKKISTPEMIVDLPMSIQGNSVDTKVRAQLENLGVETSTYTSLLPNIVKWRRKVDIRWDEEVGYWLPLSVRRIEEEPHVLALISAQEFVAMADPGACEDEKLQAHVTRLKTKFLASKVIYLIQGLEPWLKKSKNAKNREYQAAVRAQSSTDGTGGKTKRKAKDAPKVDEEAVEDALIQLQIAHECLVYQTAGNAETAEWIVHFTQHISTIPYRYAGFQDVTSSL